MNDDVPRPQLSPPQQEGMPLQTAVSSQNLHMAKPLSNYKINIDVECNDVSWWDSFSEPEFAKLLEAVLHSVLLSAKHSLNEEQTIEISCLLTSNDAIQNLNKSYRGFDKPTNILSFESGQYSPQGSQRKFPENIHMPMHLGDLVLAGRVIVLEAQNQQKTIHQHVTHLLVHGVLHLLGYDHECDEDADEMEQLEIVILRNSFGYPNPYEDTQSSQSTK